MSYQISALTNGQLGSTGSLWSGISTIRNLKQQFRTRLNRTNRSCRSFRACSVLNYVQESRCITTPSGAVLGCIALSKMVHRLLFRGVIGNMTRTREATRRVTSPQVNTVTAYNMNKRMTMPSHKETQRRQAELNADRKAFNKWRNSESDR